MPKPKYEDVLAERDALREELEAIKSIPTPDLDALREELEATKAERDAFRKEVLAEGTGKYIVTTPQGRVKLAGVVVDSSFKLTKKLEKEAVFMKLFKESIANGLIKEV